MTVTRYAIEGLVLLAPDVFRDARGYFLETFQSVRYQDILGSSAAFVQDNMSYSRYGTIRGLHFQNPPYEQAKLVRCVWGKILDVAVDIRPGSATLGKHVTVELSSEDHLQLYLPRGFAHGFAVLSPEAVVEYKCDCSYSPEADAGIRYDDPYLSIDWQIPPEKVILSAKDASLPLFSELYKGIKA